ncbi:MAG TPA: lipoprotein [Ramlibacter sp.]|nr:lipoprotein [Ramlibacter sp.]
MSNLPRILGRRWPLGRTCLLGVAAVLAGCGQRGPLYLPTDPAAAERATLPQVLSPVPTSPRTPATEGPRGGTGTGTATPVRP